MSKKRRIHVHRKRMQQGLPAIVVHESGCKPGYYSRVDIIGPSTIVHDPDKKRQPRVWIETRSLLAVTP